MMIAAVLAALAFNPLYSDHAVLQRDRDLTVWGEGAVPGERLTLTFAQSTTWTKANRDGSFRFLLPAQKAGGPFELKASGEKSGTAVATDILVGEVWLCSGQSNMEFLMKSADPGWGDRTDAELRCYRTPHQYGFGPCAESRSEWRIATPGNVRQFTAVGTFFGAALRRELQVPVGLLFSAHGGTVVEAWSSRDALQTTEAGRKALAKFASSMSDPECWKPLDEIGAKTWPKDPGPSAEALGWAKPDDASEGWRPVPVPSMFQELENRRFNGAVWYRRDIELPVEWKGRDLVLTIPAVDKHDRTYANGELIGATGSGFDTSFHDKKRVYRIPAKLVKDGRVRLAIRVWSHIYGGGICGFGEDFRLGPEGEKGLAVDGTWQAKVELDIGRTGALPTPKVAGNCNIPHALFDSKILPLIPFGIRGAIWYQGESNAGNAKDYHDFLGAMVKDWRYRWGQGNFPFISVQLAAFMCEKPFVEDDAWSEIRQAMLDLSRELPNFGIASAVDVGNALDIHPKDKLTVGERLAAWALRNTYGREDVVATGPRPRSCWQEGDGLVVRFTDVGDGLKGLSDGSVRGIYVADKDGAFHPAKASVDGADRLKVETKGIEGACEVRYAWAENPGAIDLRNSAGLPASPFRIRADEQVAVAPERRECVLRMLEGEHWWGEATWWGERMPFDKESNVEIDIRKDGYANQYQSFLVSDRGRYVWCDEQTALTVSGGVMRIVSDGAKIEVVEAGKTLREAFLAASKAHFPPSGKTPDLSFYAAPQYCTWIELTYHQNEKDILAYAQSMLDHGLPPGILMIDDTWQAGYGDWRFEPSRFVDPKGMVEKLHAMGFKVLLWMCPFVQADSPAFRLLTTGIDPNTVVRRPKTGGLLRGEEWDAENPLDRPAAVRWWNGKSALVDFTDPVGSDWYRGECDRLIREFGVDGFKMDGGHLIFYSRGYRAHADISSGLQAQAYGRICLDYPTCEFRNAYQLAGQPIVERLNDKGHSWKDLRKCVTDLIAGGLLGYSFMCPDMIGGGQWVAFLPGSKFDAELFVRSCQMQALCGMMQFSASPWRVLDAEKQEIVRKAVALRQKFAPRFVELAKACGRTGEPFLRSLEYEFPHQGYAAVKDQFMIGEFLLVAPQLEKGAARRTVKLPPGRWRDDAGKIHVGPATLSVETPLVRLPYFECVRPGFNTKDGRVDRRRE